ncbi:MAG TPA: hypothetical protein VE907_11065 [Gammaproteobacteria bacterium]|nr:hypothetical protein [Gammaproteobacteria bacterium]
MRPVIGFGGTTATLLVLVWSSASLAQGCSDLVFTGEVAQKYPNAKNACLDVVQRDGKTFAHFKARIQSIRGGQVTADFKQPDGTYTRPIEFTPPSSQRLRIAGQSLRWSELSRGQELDVYLPPDRWEIAVPDDAPTLAAQQAPVQTVPIHEPTPTFAAAPTLPRTASIVPALGLLGGLLTGLAAFVTVMRRRYAPATGR